MKFMLIILCSTSINAFHIVNDTENATTVTKHDTQLSVTIRERNTDVYKTRLPLTRLKSNYDCHDNCLWLSSSYCDFTKGICICPKNFLRFGNKCLREKVYLGAYCVYSSQCQALNSYCSSNYCRCKVGYEDFGTVCKLPTNFDRPKTHVKMNRIIIIVSAISIAIVFIILIICVASYKKSRNRGVNTVYPPPESRRINLPPPIMTVQLPPENSELHSSFPTYPAQFSGSNSEINREQTFEYIDKPPSYEEVMNSSKSTDTLTNQEILSSISCPTRISSQNTRNLSS